MSNERRQTKSSSSKRPPPPPGARPASCASCKLYKRRCSAACPLAPHFPATKMREFCNVNRLFATRFILNLLPTLSPDHRQDFIASIIYEANLRRADPVGGCCSAVLHLHRQILLSQHELQIVNLNLDSHRLAALLDSVDDDFLSTDDHE